MAPTTRQLTPPEVLQGVDEEVAYVIATPTGTTPTPIAVTVKDLTDSGTVVTSTVMPGSASASVDTITLPALKLLTAAHRYRVEVKFSSGSNVYMPYFIVEAEQ